MVRKLIRTGAACVAVLLLASAWGDTTIFGQGTVASVTINKFSYPATDDVQISGSGFTSGETVSLTITQIGGGLSVPLGTAPAVGGSFSGVSWNPDDSTRGTFLLTATGLTSAKVARAVFTVGLQTVADDAGSDDLGGQKDLALLAAPEHHGEFARRVKEQLRSGDYSAPLRSMTLVDPSPWLTDDQYFPLDEHISAIGHRTLARHLAEAMGCAPASTH